MQVATDSHAAWAIPFSGERVSLDQSGVDVASEQIQSVMSDSSLAWPVERENALGWRDAGKSGLKAECLEYIKEVWTDMRPLSLRKKMEVTSTKN